MEGILEDMVSPPKTDCQWRSLRKGDFATAIRNHPARSTSYLPTIRDQSAPQFIYFTGTGVTPLSARPRSWLRAKRSLSRPALLVSQLARTFWRAVIAALFRRRAKRAHPGGQ